MLFLSAKYLTGMYDAILFVNVEKSTFLVYAFKRGEGVAKKSTLCTLVKMLKIVNDP